MRGIIMKKNLLTILAILAIVALVLLSYRSKKTVYNDANTVGNTSGNLLNGGLFCENDGHIYFSNPKDEGRLYLMDNTLSIFTKLSEDTPTNINAAGKYIFYGRHNQNQVQDNDNVFQVSQTGLYRIDKSGKNTKTIYDKVVNSISLYGNTLYFQHNTDSGIGVSKIDIDKSNEQLLFQDPILPYVVTDNILYYVGTNKEHNIHTKNLSTEENLVLKEGNFAFLTESGGNLFFLDLKQDHALCYMPLDTEEISVLVEEPTSTYNTSLDGRYLYYQIDNGTDNGIYQMNVKRNEVICMKKGNFTAIHTTGNYIFFREFNKDTYYYAKHDTPTDIQIFEPEIDK